MVFAPPLQKSASLAVALFMMASATAGSDPTQPQSDSTNRPPNEAVQLTRDVIPALTKAGCNAGACHGSFQGRGGFALSLLGFDAAFDYDVLTKASRGRRVNPASPAQSLLLLKPMGLVPHGGGKRIAADSEVAQVLAKWMASGMPGPQANDLDGLRIRVDPPHAVLSLKTNHSTQTDSKERIALCVTATFADGSARDITRWALFDVRDRTIAEVSRSGEVTAVRCGKTAVTVRYLGQVASVGVSIPFGPTGEFDFPSENPLDATAVTEWKRLGVEPAPLTNDATFLRRVFLDLIGTLPTVDEARQFQADTSATKRSRIIDQLLERPEYVDYWSLKWGDLLRAHRRYLGDKGLASFNGWIRQSVRDNKPLDMMTRELLTAQGNLFTNGPVGYFFIDDKVEDLAETTSQVFLGIRLQCTKCHHHPNEVWSQDDYYGLAAFFSKLETKDSGTIGSRFGGPKSLRATRTINPNRKPQMVVAPRVFGARPFDRETTIDPKATTESAEDVVDPRQQLAEWITKADNPYFARNFANRYWAALFGVGLVEPVDDLRATNPASIPSVLDALSQKFVEQGFDAKSLLRTICTSRVYQLAPELNPSRDVDGTLFTHRIPRRLTAEVLLDAINQVAGTTETFTGQPVGTRAIALPDPTIASNFLSTFGRPQRNNPCECARGSNTDLSQALHLANSADLHGKIISTAGRLSAHLTANRGDDEIVDDLYLSAMTRLPTDEERTVIRELLADGTPHEATWQDILWALLNSAEFVFGH